MVSPYLKRQKIGFIGSGNMTKSLVSGLILGNVEPKFKMAENIYVSSRTEDRAKNLAKKYGVHSASHNDEILDQCDWIVLSMKPQDLSGFLESYGKSFTEHHSVISLCAGIPLESIKRELPQVKAVARLMPSTAAEFGSGVLGLYSDSENFTHDVAQFFGSVGSVQVVETEEFLDGIMISAASGVGFLLEVLQIWSEWLEDLGFTKEQSQEIARQGFGGVAEILKRSKKDFYQLQSEVTSKKGVTLAGLEAMRSSDLDTALNKGFEAALRRSQELSKLI
jgi:pyrroline-5-carboxylate reductase